MTRVGALVTGVVCLSVDSVVSLGRLVTGFVGTLGTLVGLVAGFVEVLGGLVGLVGGLVGSGPAGRVFRQSSALRGGEFSSGLPVTQSVFIIAA